MDRLKYRVWDKERKCFFNDDEVVIYPNGEKSFFNADYDFTECVVDQCTGLKDKNGKLIYEGDICRITGKYYDCTFEEWIDVDTTEEIKSLEQFFGEAMVKGVYTALGCDTLNVEIIGNTHENADLLGANR